MQSDSLHADLAMQSDSLHADLAMQSDSLHPAKNSLGLVHRNCKETAGDAAMGGILNPFVCINPKPESRFWSKRTRAWQCRAT